jgi:hypothetical protein
MNKDYCYAVCVAPPSNACVITCNTTPLPPHREAKPVFVGGGLVLALLVVCVVLIARLALKAKK